MKNKKQSKKHFKFIKTIILLFFAVFISLTLFKTFYLRKIAYPQKYKYYVEKYSQEYNIDKYIVYAVIKCESGFDTNAISHRNARGLMQISEITGLWASEVLGISNYSEDILYDPETNINIGCWYLNKLFKQFENESTAIAAYNAGSGNVSNWLDDINYSSNGVELDYIPFKETEKYVYKVERAKKMYKYLYD